MKKNHIPHKCFQDQHIQHLILCNDDSEWLSIWFSLEGFVHLSAAILHKISPGIFTAASRSMFTWWDHSHKKKHSLEIWAVKLRFLLIYENMLKSTATALVSAQQNTKTRWATTQTTLFLIWLTSLVMIKKWSKRRLKKAIFKIVKNIVLTKKLFVVSNFWEFPKHHTEK